MTTITVSSPEQQKGGISLGRQGEYGVREVVFSLSDYISEYGEGTAVLVHKLCDCADPYLVPVEDQGTFDYVERVDDTLIWHIGQMATYKKGYGQIELFWYVDDALKKSVIFGTSVSNALQNKLARPLDIQKMYLDSISKALAKSIENADVILRELDAADVLLNQALDAAENAVNLTASAETVSPNEEASVSKQVDEQNRINLHFLIPQGEKGEAGSPEPFFITFSGGGRAPAISPYNPGPSSPMSGGGFDIPPDIVLDDVPYSVDKTFAELEAAIASGATIYARYDRTLPGAVVIPERANTVFPLLEYKEGVYAKFGVGQGIIQLDAGRLTEEATRFVLNADDSIERADHKVDLPDYSVVKIDFGGDYDASTLFTEIQDAVSSGRYVYGTDQYGTVYHLSEYAIDSYFAFEALIYYNAQLVSQMFVVRSEGTVDHIDSPQSFLKPLTGSSTEVTPSQVIAALESGRPIAITHRDSVYGDMVFTDFTHIKNRGFISSEMIFVQNGQHNIVELYGTSANSVWATARTILVDSETLAARNYSSVSVTQTLHSGTEIGSVTVDGAETKLYAPSSTGVAPLEIEFVLFADAHGNTTWFCRRRHTTESVPFAEIIAAINAGNPVYAYYQNDLLELHCKLDDVLLQWLWFVPDASFIISDIFEYDAEYGIQCYEMKLEVDSSLSATSENPVQNKAIKAALDAKYVKPSGGIPATDLAAGVIPDLSGYATEQWVTDQGYLTQHQSLTAYQPKAITDTGGYYTTDTVEGALQEIGAELAVKADKTPRIAMTGADTAPTLDPNKLYVFPEMASLSPTFTAPSDNTIVNEYHFIFESGATATTTTFPAIPGLDNFAAEANMAYEVSILEGRALVISWEVSA